jgi:hypothetical protein
MAIHAFRQTRAGPEISAQEYRRQGALHGAGQVPLDTSSSAGEPQISERQAEVCRLNPDVGSTGRMCVESFNRGNDFRLRPSPADRHPKGT